MQIVPRNSYNEPNTFCHASPYKSNIQIQANKGCQLGIKYKTCYFIQPQGTCEADRN